MSCYEVRQRLIEMVTRYLPDVSRLPPSAGSPPFPERKLSVYDSDLVLLQALDALFRMKGTHMEPINDRPLAERIGKRFWLFHGSRYYPAGGMKDFIDSFDTLEAAQAGAVINDSAGWAHILDTQNGQIVLQYNDATYVNALRGWRTPSEMEIYFHKKSGDQS